MYVRVCERFLLYEVYLMMMIETLFIYANPVNRT